MGKRSRGDSITHLSVADRGEAPPPRHPGEGRDLEQRVLEGWCSRADDEDVGHGGADDLPVHGLCVVPGLLLKGIIGDGRQ